MTSIGESFSIANSSSINANMRQGTIQCNTISWHMVLCLSGIKTTPILTVLRKSLTLSWYFLNRHYLIETQILQIKIMNTQAHCKKSLNLGICFEKKSSQNCKNVQNITVIGTRVYCLSKNSKNL